ncbi:hypothetical protein [Dehalogenimonas alkenigignens]|uniref:Uncharacterized protein n=1 Tax=Dehalogenimonas alkenigignens TaxID=1217799 RepID=A0A0W0GHP9_9CHLR|nr:hypothetical protein [Dehalogenimonas alkenigignens]KTB48065.1 hypothetical protein DEALK_09100 [Dehalogenimonas alkenigignens]PVV84318.1 hypothetical protein DD509_03210 [Dehalogenimonas alkenigignens]
MVFMRVCGLILIVAAIICMFAAVIAGDSVALFVAALVSGVIGNILFWMAKQRQGRDESDSESEAP